MRKKHTPARQGTPEEVIRGKQTSRILRITQRHIHKDALHDDKARRSVDGDADGGRNPVDALAGGPRKQEEADRGTKGCGKRRDQPALLDGEAELADARVHVEVEVAAVDGDAEDAGDEDAEEDEADLAEVHVVVDGVDEREDLEEGVVDAVDDGGVDLDEENGGVFECDFDGFDERVEEDVRDFHVALVDFGLGHEARVSGEGPETSGPAEENVGPTCLREGHKHGQENRRRRPNALKK